MAKKQTTKKARKPAKGAAKRTPRPRAARPAQAPADTSALSVTDGQMKDVFRSAFLRRDS